MFTRVKIAILLILALSLFTGSVLAFWQISLDTISKGWGEYNNAFSHGSGSSQHEMKQIDSKGKVMVSMISKNTFAFAGKCKRLYMEVWNEGDKSPYMERLYCLNSKYIFQLEKKGKDWLLSKMVLLPNDNAKHLLESINSGLRGVRSLDSVDGAPLTVLASNLRLESNADGESLRVSLTKESQFPFGPHIRTFRTLTADLGEGPYYPLKKADAEFKAGNYTGTLSTQNEFLSVKGLPIPLKTLTRIVARLPGNMTINDNSESTYQIDPSVTPAESDFTLSAFGLPEPEGIKWDKPTPLYIWILLAAAGFGILALSLRFLTHRKPPATKGTV